ncbi:33685_t:CDS:1, partial [Gigaspora margarita]
LQRITKRKNTEMDSTNYEKIPKWTTLVMKDAEIHTLATKNNKIDSTIDDNRILKKELIKLASNISEIIALAKEKN